MSLYIGVGRNKGKSCFPPQEEPGLSLDDGGYYWFLYPLIERLYDETGQFIDLYTDARFTPSKFPALERMLAAAEKLIRKQPARWQVLIGVQVKPVRKELYTEVERAKFLKFLGVLRKVIARAKKLRRPVVCFGDQN
jgi:hypothetical protein